MSDIVSFAWLKVAGSAAWWIVRWFPLPINRAPSSLIRRANVYLWRKALSADYFSSLALWRQHRGKAQ